MAPVAGNPTQRLKVSYEGPYGRHVMLFHGDASATKASLVAAARGVIEQMATLQYDGTTWDAAEYALPNSTVFNPEPWTPLVSNSESNPISNSSPAVFAQFGGRDSAGVRVRFYLYETYLPLVPDMRYGVGENAQVAAVVSELADLDNTIVTKGNGTPVWKTYANLGVNDYLTDKARG